MSWLEKAEDAVDKVFEATAVPIPDFAKSWFGTTPDEEGNPSYPSHIDISGTLYFSDNTESTNE